MKNLHNIWYRPVVSSFVIVLAFFAFSCQKQNAEKNATVEKNVTIKINKISNQSLADFPPNSITKSGYTLDFDEEFNAPNLDTTKWLKKYFPHATSSSSLGMYAKYNLDAANLNLYIDATTQPWTPGDVTYNFRASAIQTFEKNGLHPGAGPTVTPVSVFNGYSTKYGYYEMRAKLPSCGGGGTSAWWLIGTQDDTDASGLNSKQNAEIDIVEANYNSSYNSCPKVHPWNDPLVNFWVQSVNNPGNPTTEYHIYAMDWTPTRIKFYYDNQLIATTSNSPNYKMCMFFSLYTNSSGVSNPDNGVYPKTLSVDYVRVWKLNTGYTSNYYLIKNRNTGQYLNLQNNTGKVESTNISPDSLKAQWSLEYHDGYTRFKNRVTNTYLQDNGGLTYLQYGTIGAGWWSPDYSLVANGAFFRLRNRNNGNFINLAHGYSYAETTASVPTSWWAGDWTIVPYIQ